MTTGLKDPRNIRHVSITQVDFKDDNAIVNFVQGRWERRDQYRHQIERQWYLNIANYLGYQYHNYDDYTGILHLPKAPKWRVRLVANRLMLVARKVVSKALRQRPIWTVLPASAEDEDRRVAKVSEKILRYYWRWLKMDRLLVDLFTWTATTGNAFMRVYWDPQAGPEMAFDQDELEGLDPEMQALYQAAGVNLGDVAVDVVPPFEVDVDPEAQRFEDASHIIHTKLRNIDYLQDRYDVKGLNPDGSDDQTMSRYYERRIQTLVGRYGAGVMKNQEEEQNSTLTHTLWVNPTKRHRNGFYAVVASGRVLTKGDLPNSFRKIPYTHLIEIPVPGRLWGTCALEQCIPLQAEYNRGRSQLIENRNLMTRPKWLVPNGANVPEMSLTSEPGEVIPYTPGLKPEAWQPPPLPEYVPKLLEYALKDLEDGSGIHEVTQARAPSGVRSGVAIAQLQEQDDQMLAPTFFLAELCLSQVGSWLLRLLADNVNEERVIRLVGNDKQVESMQFTGQSIYGPNSDRPGVNYFDVETQVGSQFPLSKSARLQFAIDLVNSRILDPMQDRKRIFEILELGTEEPALDVDQLDRQHAMRENILMAQGQLVEVNPWDNDIVHIEELRKYQKQPEFQEVIRINPQAFGIFENHFAQHSMRLQALMSPAPQPAQMQSNEEAPVGPAQPSVAQEVA